MRRSVVRPVDRAIWYIETHLDSNASLEDIASHACVSKHHLLRAFAAATGLSIMRYVRSRRLSAAARRLAQGSPDILAIAMDTGYSSHEAFTRAFRDQFGLTPGEVRAQAHLNNVSLQEPVAMSNEPVLIESPQFRSVDVLLIAGLNQRYEGPEAGAGIPAQWRRFLESADAVGERVDEVNYGVCYNTDDQGGMDYLCGIEVAHFHALPASFAYLRIPAAKYAVFAHRGHISTIRGTWNAIWNGWLPQSGHEVLDAPIIERYDAGFDPHTGHGGVELWVALR
jgi:AraC family transcriptional regulator